MGVSSEQGCTNMNRFVVACAFVACAYGAPMPEADYAHGVVGAVGYAGAGLVGAPVASAPAVVGQTHHSYAAGAPVVGNRVEYGIVGQRTVQTGVQQVVAGHAYAVAGQETIPRPAHSYVAGEAKNLVETVALPPPAIPAPPAPYAAIPPAPVPAGPAPADTVVQTKIAAPVRTHTRITPQVTNIVPQINVQKYNVDVPVAVPRAVHVPAPYKVHPVQEIVETPHIHHATYETHSSQAVVTAHATPVHAVSHVPVAAAAPVAAVGYAGHAVAAPAVGYAGYTGHAVAAPAVGYAGHAGHAIAAPAVAAATA